MWLALGSSKVTKSFGHGKIHLELTHVTIASCIPKLLNFDLRKDELMHDVQTIIQLSYLYSIFGLQVSIDNRIRWFDFSEPC